MRVVLVGMQGEPHTSVGIPTGNDGTVSTEYEDNQMGKGSIFGDIMWVRVYKSSWWPAQVVDKNGTSGSAKVKKKKEGEVLVRLYGSYEYLYVDPTKCRSNFEKVLKQSNLSLSEIFQKALEEDKSRYISFANSKRKAYESEEKTGSEKSTPKKMKEKTKRMEEANNTLGTSSVAGRTRTKIYGFSPGKADDAKKNQQASDPDSDVEVLEVRRISTVESLKKSSLEGAVKTPKQAESKKKAKSDSPSSANVSKGNSQYLSSRPKKMMQMLGLIAPRGSPFSKRLPISPPRY